MSEITDCGKIRQKYGGMNKQIYTNQISDEALSRYLHEVVMEDCWHELNHQKNACVKCKQQYGGLAYWEPPNYCNDLNALARVELRVVGDVGAPEYAYQLVQIAGSKTAALIATARQRAEACKEAWGSLGGK